MPWKQFTYFTLGLRIPEDREIIDWIESFPWGQRSEQVRKALRWYIRALHEGKIEEEVKSHEG